jgi:hypothetical protein
VPRRTWLDSKIDVFLEELAASGMHLGRQRAGELITGHVRAVATLLRVTEATARTYLGDEIIKDMARRMLFEVAGERPGAGVAGAATLALDQCDPHRPTPSGLSRSEDAVSAADQHPLPPVRESTREEPRTGRAGDYGSSPARPRVRILARAAPP